MFTTLRTLFNGASARSEEHVRDVFAIELIDQKIREANQSLQVAKKSLATLIQQARNEDRAIENLNGRIETLLSQAKDAMEAGKEDLAQEAAQAIANMENELKLRQQTAERLETRITRLRSTVETANRRIVDLKQGALMARSVRQEQASQTRLNTTGAGQSSMDEADALISRVMEKSDPFEQSEILQEIDAGLSHQDIGEKLADAGFGKSDKTTAQDVLARLAKK